MFVLGVGCWQWRREIGPLFCGQASELAWAGGSEAEEVPRGDIQALSLNSRLADALIYRMGAAG